ncbi:uncharacterized protein LOC141726846 [Zonotrichia albicollis]|uniref:uncharacterized protein LOC141726846 n=1 Tax=Zonotrichia albicollis TaxID=44394 RepID=UPI003D80F6F4
MQRRGNTRMSGSISRTEHIRDTRDSSQEGAVCSEPQGGACGSRGRLSRPWISPGGSERTGTRGGTHPVRPLRAARGRSAGAARHEPNPLGAGGDGGPWVVPFLRLPWEGTHPASSAPARGAGAGMGVEVGMGMGRPGCSCAPRRSAGAGCARGKAAERRADRCPPRGHAEPSLTSGAVGSGEGDARDYPEKGDGEGEQGEMAAARAVRESSSVLRSAGKSRRRWSARTDPH